MTIQVYDFAGPFAEDKDIAKAIREDYLLPAIATKESVTLDFDQVQSSTQSFVHALISKSLLDGGEGVLDIVTFANCSDKVRELIVMVTNYSLE